MLKNVIIVVINFLGMYAIEENQWLVSKILFTSNFLEVFKILHKKSIKICTKIKYFLPLNILIEYASLILSFNSFILVISENKVWVENLSTLSLRYSNLKAA